MIRPRSLRVMAIAAMDEGRVIGCEGQLPWHLPEDLKHFAALTRGHTVLMGRKTWESLKPQHRPLKERLNVVVTRDPGRIEAHPQVHAAATPLDFIRACRAGEVDLPSDQLWVIGGGEVYRATLSEWDEVYLTLIFGQHRGDAFFPEFEDRFELTGRDDRQGFSFLQYGRRQDGSVRS